MIHISKFHLCFLFETPQKYLYVSLTNLEQENYAYEQGGNFSNKMTRNEKGLRCMILTLVQVEILDFSVLDSII